MKRRIFIYPLLLLMLLPFLGNAQATDSDVLTFYTEKEVGETIKLSLKYEGMLQIDGLESVPPSQNYTYHLSDVKLTKQKVVIKGKLISLGIHNEQEITRIDAPGHETLQEVYCVNNAHFKVADFAKSSKLKLIFVAGSGLKGADLTKFVQTLPKVANGSLVIYRAVDGKKAPATWTIADIATANAKGWHINAIVKNVLSELYPDEITFTLDPSKEKKFRMGILGSYSDVPFISDIASNPFIEQSNTFVEYTTDKGSVTIGGNTSSLRLEGRNVTGLLIGKNRSLERLAISNLSIKEADFSGCETLHDIDCFDNGIRGEATTRLMASLPDRRTLNKAGKIVFTKENSKISNEYTDQDLYLAKTRNWSVWKRNKGGSDVEITPKGSYKQFSVTTDKKPGDPFYVYYYAQSEKDAVFGGVRLLPKEKWTNDKNAILTAQKVLFVGNIFTLVLPDQQITSITTEDYPELRSLEISGNKLERIDLSRFTELLNVGCARNPFTQEGATFTLSHLPDRSSKEEAGRIVFVSDDDDAPQINITNEALLAAGKLNWKVMRRHKDGKETEIQPKEETTITLVTERAIGEKVSIHIANEDGQPVSVTGLNVPTIESGVELVEYTLTSQTVTITGSVNLLEIPHGGWTQIVTSDNNPLKMLVYPKNKVVAPILHTPMLEMVQCNNNGMSVEQTRNLIASLRDFTPFAKEGQFGSLLLEDETLSEAINAYTDAEITAANAKNWKCVVKFSEELAGELFTSDKNVLRINTQLPKMSKIRFTIHYNGALLAADGIGKQKELPKSSDKEQEGELTANFVRFVGDIDNLNIANLQVTRLEMRGNKSIARVNCANNAIASFDLSNCEKLYFLNLTKNGLKADFVSQLIAQLPDRSAEADKGELRLFDTFKGQGESNELSSDHVRAANAKGWRITDATKEITAELLGSELVLRPQESDDTIYTLDGIRLYTSVDELSEGIYIIGGKKVIINHSK